MSRMLTAATLFLISSIMVFAADQGAAKAIFNKRCTSCHTFGKGVKVGPDLKGVTLRHKRDWLIGFIRSSSVMIGSGDRTAVALFRQFKQERMPDWTDLSREQIDEILDYFAADGPEQKEPDERHAKTATLAEAQMGRRLFHGQTSLAYGGQSCGACHAIHDPELAASASLGPDLTSTYYKYQDKGLTDFLRRPCFIRNPEDSEKRYLTPQEMFDLKAYMALVAGVLIPAPPKEAQLNSAKPPGPGLQKPTRQAPR